MKNPKTLLFAAALLLGALPLQAGLWDDVKQGVQAARDIVDDVDETHDSAKETAGDARDMAEETSEDAKGVLPDAPAAEAGAPPPPSASAPPPPPSGLEWRIDVGGGKTRTVSQDQLVAMIRSGEVGRDTFVWTRDLGDWTAAGQVPALAGQFKR